MFVMLIKGFTKQNLRNVINVVFIELIICIN